MTRAAVTMRRQAAVDGDWIDRFWNCVERTDRCWLWHGNRYESGYGYVKLPGGKAKAAHRMAYELLGGVIPDGLVLDHLCRVRNCVKPTHLEPVTQQENTRRGHGPSGKAGRTTHCPQGHPYDSVNTKITPRGHRRCLTCQPSTDSAGPCRVARGPQCPTNVRATPRRRKRRTHDPERLSVQRSRRCRRTRRRSRPGRRRMG